MALDGIDRKHHSGIITEFRRLYVKLGIFDDYDDFFIISKAEVAEQVETAKEFFDAVSAYLQNT